MKLLKQLYGIYSGSRNERPMRDFICAWVKKNVNNATVEVDKVGNVLVTRGESDTFPCIVSHMDQVQQRYPETYQVMSNGHVIFAMDFKRREYCGLGADDKNGIWICLNALKEYKVMKCAFFVNEESGMTGSSGIDMAFFDDCRWVVQCDRKGYQDFITYTNGVEVCTDKFVKACNLKSHRYEKCNGLATDVGNLKKRGLKVCAVNLSCGYYEAHTDREFTVVPDLLKCQKLVHFMVEHLTDVFPHEYKPYCSNHSIDYNKWHRSFGPGAFLTYGSDRQVAADCIETRMENNHRAKYMEYDDEKIKGIAKDMYNRIGYVYGVGPEYCENKVREIIENWTNEDAQEQYQMLYDSMADMYDNFCYDGKDILDDEDEDVGVEICPELDCEFIAGICATLEDDYPLLSNKDVVDIFNELFGASYKIEDIRQCVDEITELCQG